MGHQRFPEDEGRHLRVGLVVQQKIQRMIPGFLGVVIRLFIDMKRQRGNGFRENSHTRINSRHLHGGALVDSLSGGGRPKEKTVSSTCGLISDFSMKQIFKFHGFSFPKRKAPAVRRCLTVNISKR